jgi:adenosylmethionine-8-amino-7-oxononanoate aminotransferase
MVKYTEQTQHTWLPAAKPDTKLVFRVVKATGSHLHLDNGMQIYDAISSWWCKPLGHCHPLIAESLNATLPIMEHHIPANLYNDTIENLSAKLLKPFKKMDKVMYASDGSSAVEMAMKLSYESRLLNGQPERSQFIALNNAYHGETIFTLSICGIDEYKSAYTPFIFPNNHFIQNIPYVSSRNDPRWHDYTINNDTSSLSAANLEEYIATIAPHVTALIIEPIVQGAAGLKIISRDFLIKLINIAKQYGIHIISDEIMVGLGRIGHINVTTEILQIEPDFVCIAKNLTAGSIPMSAIIINNSISDLFRHADKIFPHSHTHSCNILAATVANSYLDLLYKDNSFLSNVIGCENHLNQIFTDLAQQYDFITNVRAIGGIAACDLELKPATLDGIFLLGIQNGIYLRPIGKTLYLMPPLYNLANDIAEIKSKITRVIAAVS